MSERVKNFFLDGCRAGVMDVGGIGLIAGMIEGLLAVCKACLAEVSGGVLPLIQRFTLDN